MQFSECQPADGISAAAQNGSFGLSCGAALLPSYTNTLVAGRRPMSPNLTTRKALGGAATATAILGTRDVLESGYPRRRITVLDPEAVLGHVGALRCRPECSNRTSLGGGSLSSTSRHSRRFGPPSSDGNSCRISASGACSK